MSKEAFEVDFKSWREEQVLLLSMKIFKEVTKKNGTAPNSMWINEWKKLHKWISMQNKIKI